MKAYVFARYWLAVLAARCRPAGFALGAAVAVLGLLAPAVAVALDGKVDLADLHHDIWTAKNGAPGEVSCMAQTRDGWVWIGSATGLYRFDGIRFQRFDGLPGDVAPARAITALTALHNGDLLIGTLTGGLSVLHDGHISAYPAKVGDTVIGPVLSAAVDEDGMLWMATSTGLLQLREGSWRNAGSEMGLPLARVSNLIVDQYGQLWVAAGNTLFVLERGAKRFRAVLTGAATVNLSESPDGRLWLDTHDRLIPVPPQHRGPSAPRPDWLAQARGQENGLFDRDGNYWSLGCPVGICRAAGVGAMASATMTPNAGPRSQLDQPWQVSSLMANILFEDREGGIWVGTQEGVERFRHNRLASVKLARGDRHFSLARDAAGAVLLQARPSGALWKLLPDGASESQGPTEQELHGDIANTADGALLVARAQWIERRAHGKVERIAYPPASAATPAPVRVTRLLDDGEQLWISIAFRGSFRLRDGKWSNITELGLPQGVFFAAAGAKGAVWLGYRDGAVIHYDHGRSTRYSPARGVNVGAITFLHAGRDVVAGGDTGLAVLDGASFRRLRAADPDVISSVSGMVIGADGDRWFNGSRGVVHVTAAHWRAALASRDGLLDYTLIGVLDGYPGAAATATRRATAIGGADGSMWFVGSTGVTMLDPRKATATLRAPQVLIETLATAKRRYAEFPRMLVLDPGTSALRFEYTALSFTLPELLRFRYQLVGIDQGWQDVGARRAVSYTNLGPGDYRFRVAAVDADGRWSEGDTEVALRILPTFTQTWLFDAVCALAAGGAIYLIYLLRMKRAMLRIADRVAERERIARTLHDTFLQNVQGLILSFQSALMGLPSESPTRCKMERVLALADRVMEEGRDQVQDLRSTVMRDGDLNHALMVVGEVLEEDHAGTFSLRSDGDPVDLSLDLCEDIYSIGREAIINAFRHARAASIGVELVFGAALFELHVTDDGAGMAEEIIESGQRQGHWGLPGMFERAGRIGAGLTVDSVVGGGTRVALRIPAGLAYAQPTRWRALRCRVTQWFSAMRR